MTSPLPGFWLRTDLAVAAFQAADGQRKSSSHRRSSSAVRQIDGTGLESLHTISTPL